MYYIVGLGNPGEEYVDTRHNAGRIAVEVFARMNDLPDFVVNKKAVGEISQGEITTEKGVRPKVTEKVFAILPNTFMNKSGSSVAPFITSVKKAESLIVVQDDLDMPIGKIKLLFNRGSGGHKGVESIRRAVKTDAFLRIKIGISPATAKGKARKPDSEKILDFIIAKFKKPELDEIKKVAKRASDAIRTVVLEGREKAMSEFNKG